MDLIAALKAYHPWNTQEARDREVLLRRLESGEPLYGRENLSAHLTASAWVVSPDRTKVLLAHHNLYNSWAWLGGHADGETDLLAVAVREAKEESGLTDIHPVSENIFSVEILAVNGHEKHGQYVPSHLHLNVTFLLEANPTGILFCRPGENSQVAWFSQNEVLAVSAEPWFRDRIYRKLNEKTAYL